MIYLILLLALSLRLVNLNQSLWLDEATQAILSQGSIHSIIFERSADFHPPLSYLLLHFWMKLGSSEIWLRLLSVIFGVLTVWISYSLAAKMFKLKVAIFYAFLLAIAPYHIYYSQEVRMYSLMTFLATLSMYFFYLMVKNNRLFYMVGFILSSVALLYTHYLGIFLLVAQFLFLVCLEKNKLSFYLKILSFTLLAWLPGLPILLSQLKNGVNVDQYLPGWREILTLSFYKAIPLTFLKFSIGRIDFDNLFVYIIISLGVLSVIGYLFIKVSLKATRDIKFYFLWLLVPILITWLISLRLPINQPFRLLFVLPSFYLLISVGIFNLTKFKKAMIVTVVAISFTGLLFYYLDSKFWREDWRNATHFVRANLGQDSLVAFAWPEPFSPYLWYGGREEDSVAAVKKFPATYEEINSNLASQKNASEIYFFEYLQPLSDPQKYTQQWFRNNGFHLNRTIDFRGVGFIDQYLKL